MTNRYLIIRVANPSGAGFRYAIFDDLLSYWIVPGPMRLELARRVVNRLIARTAA